MADYETKDDKKVLRGKTYEYQKDYRSDLDMHDKYIVEWDAHEAMLISKTYDAVSRQTKNGITDSEAATMIIERSARVVGQLPIGETEAAGQKDRGKALFMDIIRQKSWYPNANAQRPFLDKIRLWEMYSGVYGGMLMYYDWDVAPSGYVGPNCWLWNPRNFIPQQGKYTIGDMDYAHAISWMTEKDIQDIVDKMREDEKFAEDSGWDLSNMETILETVKNSSKDMDNSRNTYVERLRNTSAIKGRIQIVTRFEASDDGRWCTFTPDFSCLQLRDIPNPHHNAKIPFINKPAIPLLDSFYNLSDMARAKPIQFAKDGLTNFYFQGIKMNIYPPTVVNAQGILKHTVSNEPGAIWEEIMPNSARRLETSTAGLSTFQAAMGMMNGALQNVFGTTTTQSTAESAMSPQFGKTPEAIKYQTGRESARDNQNRAYLQSAIEQLMDAFAELTVNVGTEPIDVTLFSEDIKEIQRNGYDDIMEVLLPNESMTSGRLLIDPTKLKGVTYRFSMKPDSTIKMSKQEQKQNLLDFMDVLSKHTNELQEIQKTSGKSINWEKLIGEYASLADLPGLEDIFVQGEKPQDPSQNPVLQLMERMNVKFETLPESAQAYFLQQWGAPADGSPTTTQQQTDIKAHEAQTKQQLADAKVLETHSNIIAGHAQQTEQPAQSEKPQAIPPPQSVNGMIFHDPTLHSVASDLHAMRPEPMKQPAPTA